VPIKFVPFLQSWLTQAENGSGYLSALPAAFIFGALGAVLAVAVIRGIQVGLTLNTATHGRREVRLCAALAGILVLFGLTHPLAAGFGLAMGHAGSLIGSVGVAVFLVCRAIDLLLEHPGVAVGRVSLTVLLLGGFAAGLPVLGLVDAGTMMVSLSLLLGLGFLAYAVVLTLGKKQAGRLFAFSALCLAASGSVFIPHPLLPGAAISLLVALRLLSDRSAPPKPLAVQVALPAAELPVLSDYVDQVSVSLTRFIPKEFLAILNKPNFTDLRLGDHVKSDMTIFFSDIRQFTNLSEGLTPEESFKFINSYLARMVPVINSCGGFVDKYMGDAVMALFPAKGGADAAVRAAIEMQQKIIEYNSHRANSGYRPLSMGIGLHTGTLMLGVVGVEDRMQNTVISDAVNLASRLESITKVFRISLAISEETFKNLEDPGAYLYRFIGKVRVKGKYEPVSVFEIFDGINPEMLSRKMKANIFFEQGMLSYYQKDFSGAMYNFRKVLEIVPEDGASAFYLDNCMAKVRT